MGLDGTGLNRAWLDWGGQNWNQSLEADRDEAIRAADNTPEFPKKYGVLAFVSGG